MTMVPAENISKQQHLFYSTGYGGCGGSSSNYTESFGDDLMSRIQGYDHYNSSQACVGSDLVIVSTINNNNNNNIDNPMDEDESRTNSLNEAASSSRENNNNNTNNNNQEERDDDGWLQLSIGSHRTSQEIKHEHQEDPTAARRRGGTPLELDLLPPGGTGTSSYHQINKPCTLASPLFHQNVPPHEFRPPRPLMNISGAANLSTTSLFFQQGSSSTFPHQEINWAFRPIPQHIAMVTSSSYSSPSPSSSSSTLMPFGLGPYFTRPYHDQMHSGMDIAGPSSDIRIIDPPRRPHSGIWFMLLASQNQAKEPFLPQIPKSYLRIKDGRMTIRLLKKYLVNKLRLDSESEQIEITCRGEQLLPCLTLQHVRDHIWSPKDAVTLHPESSATDHVMVLYYGRTSSTA